MDTFERDDTSDFDDRIDEDWEILDVETDEKEPLREEEDFYRHLEEY